MRAKLHQMDSPLYDEAQSMAGVLKPIFEELVQESSARSGDPATALSVGATAIVFLATSLSDSVDEMLGQGVDKAGKRAMIEGLSQALNQRLTRAAQRQNGELN